MQLMDDTPNLEELTLDELILLITQRVVELLIDENEASKEKQLHLAEIANLKQRIEVLTAAQHEKTDGNFSDL